MTALAIVISVSVPLGILLTGIYCQKSFPKEINSAIGYRTKRSMASQEAWEYSNKRITELWIKEGIIMLFPSVIITLIITFMISPDVGVYAATVIELVEVALIFIPVAIIEKELKKQFFMKEENNDKDRH